MCPIPQGSNDLQSRRRPIPKLGLHAILPTSSAAAAAATTRVEKKKGAQQQQQQQRPPFIVRLSPKSLVLSLTLATAFAFILGAVSRLVLLAPPVARGGGAPYHNNGGGIDEPTASAMTNMMLMMTTAELPRPTVEEGKDVPFTTFATKQFANEGARTNSTVHLDRTAFLPTNESGAGEESETEDFFDEEEEELHLPAGQHLLVDIENVDPTFLNSEVRLAEAMIELINESKLTLLSYHCHSLVPAGVSCAGVLLESHVAFHTWPEKGVLAMDLFTCGAGLLVPVLPVIKELFGVPALDEFGRRIMPDPKMAWSHKLRGFRQDFSPSYKRHENPLEQDLGDLLQRGGTRGRTVEASVATAFQRVDVVIDDRPHSGASWPEGLDVAEKTLFLDGVQQSSLRGDAAYHEALVHPSMIAHPDPRRVAIVGGGEGATLREVLRHGSVEEVRMVEIDGELVELCREHLPEWSDCSDMEGSDADSCFDDSRTSLAFEDAFKWFLDSFGSKDSEEEKFDVIIMDALDPDQMVEIVGDLYKNNNFVDALYNGLNDEGVFVIQLGEADRSDDPGEDVGQSNDVANMRKGLQEVGFQSMHIYDESHSHFEAPWSYLVCFKDSKMRSRWYRSAAEIEVDLHSRVRGTRSGAPPLSFFDGSTMLGYQLPHKAFETVYCRGGDEPWECEDHVGMDPEWKNVPAAHLEARKSTVGDFAGRGLFAAEDIPAYSTFDIQTGTKAFHVSPSSWSIVEELYKWAEDEDFGHAEEKLSRFFTFTEGYGYGALLLGTKHFTVDAGILTFCNHGCNGTYSFGDEEGLEFTELNVGLHRAPEVLLNKASEVYSPVMERHLRQQLSFGDYTLRNIRQGEEILCDYLSYVGDPEDWEEEVTSLRGQCSGKMMGDIAEYEFKADDYQLTSSHNSSNDLQAECIEKS